MSASNNSVIYKKIIFSVYLFFKKKLIPLVLYLSNASGMLDIKAVCYFPTFLQDGAAV